MKNIKEFINESVTTHNVSYNPSDVKLMFTPGIDASEFPGIIVGKPFKKNEDYSKYEKLVKEHFNVGETQIDPFEDASRNQLFVWFVNTSTDNAGDGYIRWFGKDEIGVII